MWANYVYTSFNIYEDVDIMMKLRGPKKLSQTIRVVCCMMNGKCDWRDCHLKWEECSQSTLRSAHLGTLNLIATI